MSANRYWNAHRSIVSNVHSVTTNSSHPGRWVRAPQKSCPSPPNTCCMTSSFISSCSFAMLESQSWALCSGVWSLQTARTCSWLSSTSVWRLRLGPGRGCHWRCWCGRCCLWGQLRAMCPVLLQPKQITSLILFWALFGLATACPHLFPPGRKSSASASRAWVHPGDMSIGLHFGAPKGALLGCGVLHGTLNFSSCCLNPSCHPFRWMNRFVAQWLWSSSLCTWRVGVEYYTAPCTCCTGALPWKYRLPVDCW